MREIIIDIETLSTQYDASIMTIGAIIFDRYENKKELTKLKTFYKRINRNSCRKLNLYESKETLEWWDKQPEDSRYEVFGHPDRVEIEEALNELKLFCTGCERFWSQGNFDYPILSNAYNVLKIEAPWKFWQIRDSRTLFDVCNINLKNFKNEESDHHALLDCYCQYLATIDAIKLIKDI